MTNLKKIFTISVLLISLMGFGVKASAASWNYGYTVGGAYSHYYHESKTHSATVVNRNNGNRGYDSKGAGAWAKASVSLPIIGGQASFYYNAW